jgi:hypothetical protein
MSGKCIAVRDRNGDVARVEQSTQVSVLDLDKLRVRCVKILIAAWHEFDLGNSARLSSLGVIGWDAVTQSAVVRVEAHQRGRSAWDKAYRDTFFLATFEANQPFAYPISPRPVERALIEAAHDLAAPIEHAKRWLWRTTAREMEKSERRRELLIVPVPHLPRGALRLDENEAAVGRGHHLRAVSIARHESNCYALRPELTDSLGSYAQFRGKSQWYALRMPRDHKSGRLCGVKR